jgi:proteasome regulatory subunit
MIEPSRHIPDPQSPEDIYCYLVERLTKYEAQNSEQLDQIRVLESDKNYLEGQKIRFEREVKRLKSEVEHLKTPPLLLGSITDVIDKSRAIIRSSAGPRFLVRVSQSVDPESLVIGARCTLNQQSLAIIEVLPSSFDSQIYGMELESTPAETYEDIGGLDEQITEIREAVELPMTRPDLFHAVGITPPKGVLLYGPPGTGKTLLARAVAHETDACFMYTVGSELVQKYIGEGARLVRELFELAKQRAPTIVFIDEIDAVGASRSEITTAGDREVQRTLIQLLSAMDGFDNRGEVRIIGATNRIDILDAALLRPGRFDRIIQIPLPDTEGRLSILKVHTRSMNVTHDVDLFEIARLTDGRNGADLRAICTEAGMYAIRREETEVTQTDFLTALRKFRADVEGKVAPLGAMYA